VLVEKDADLERALAPFQSAKLLTLDTEFLWERTYHPILALVQLGARLPDGSVHAVAIDPLGVQSLGPLERLLADPSRLKVVHAGRIDLEIFHARTGGPIGPVFGTQRAAALAGFGQQVGYAALVEGLLGRRLDKVEQSSDWTRRPLRPEQVSYALLDVVPLLDVHDRLRAQLGDAKRLTWAEEEMTPLVDPASYVPVADEERWRSVKQRRGLDRRGLAILRELAAWREATARERDLRPGFVCKDPILVDIARRAPVKAQTLDNVRGLHPNEAKRHGQDIVAAVKRALDLPESALPPMDKRPRGPDPQAAVDLLRAFLSQRAQEVGVAAETLATTADLVRLSRAHLRGEKLDAADDDEDEGSPADRHDVLSGWRGELLGRDLVRLLKGEISLRVDPGTGQLEAR
jgi:ribonuclease D